MDKCNHLTYLPFKGLKLPKRIQFRLCVLVYRRLHGIGPSYLYETLRLTSSVESCRRLYSRSTIETTRIVNTMTTLDDRASPVAA